MESFSYIMLLIQSDDQVSVKNVLRGILHFHNIMYISSCLDYVNLWMFNWSSKHPSSPNKNRLFIGMCSLRTIPTRIQLVNTICKVSATFVVDFTPFFHFGVACQWSRDVHDISFPKSDRFALKQWLISMANRPSHSIYRFMWGVDHADLRVCVAGCSSLYDEMHPCGAFCKVVDLTLLIDDAQIEHWISKCSCSRIDCYFLSAHCPDPSGQCASCKRHRSLTTMLWSRTCGTRLLGAGECQFRTPSWIRHVFVHAKSVHVCKTGAPTFLEITEM